MVSVDSSARAAGPDAVAIGRKRNLRAPRHARFGVRAPSDARFGAQVRAACQAREARAARSGTALVPVARRTPRIA
eukprot:scaffold15222_cov78-Phaeocystis_antarctica.AAC.1